MATTNQTSPNRVQFMLRALNHRNYRLFFGGQIVSLAGTWMTQIAMTWLVYKLTGSAWKLGLVGFSGQIPAFLLGPFAGVIVDRFPRHRLLVITQILAMLQSGLLAVLTLTGLISVNYIIALIIFQGLINAFDIPARQAFVVEMVDNKEDLSNAIALNSSMFNLARLIGPAVGGILIAIVGEGWCFAIDSASYVAVIAALLMMRVAPHVTESKRGQAMQELREGFAYVVKSKPISSILMLLACLSLFAMPYGVLMPIVAGKTLVGGPNVLGFLMAASGFGALSGALVLAARSSIRGLGRNIPFCVAAFGLGLICFGLSTNLYLSMMVLWVMGFAGMTQMASCNTILQTIVEDSKRGRVMSFYTMAFMGVMPFGSLGAGKLADVIGVSHTLMIGGGACLLVALWFGSRYPVLRDIVSPIYDQMGIAPAIARGIEDAAELNTPPVRSA